MSVSTTFGYNAAEDRLWMRCEGWPQRLWLTRRIAQAMLWAVVELIEAPPRSAQNPSTQSAGERAAAEHDAALNRPQAGEPGHTLRMGREVARAHEHADAVVCRRFTLVGQEGATDLIFQTQSGEYRVQLSRIGLHRWLHALQLVLATTGWSEWNAAPEWLTRSYLPAALKNLLAAPLPPGAPLDDDTDCSGAPAP